MGRGWPGPSLSSAFVFTGVLAPSVRSTCHQSTGDSLRPGNSTLHWTLSLKGLLLRWSGDSYTLEGSGVLLFLPPERQKTNVSLPSSLGTKVQPQGTFLLAPVKVGHAQAPLPLAQRCSQCPGLRSRASAGCCTHLPRATGKRAKHMPKLAGFTVTPPLMCVGNSHCSQHDCHPVSQSLPIQFPVFRFT